MERRSSARATNEGTRQFTHSPAPRVLDHPTFYLSFVDPHSNTYAAEDIEQHYLVLRQHQEKMTPIYITAEFHHK